MNELKCYCVSMNKAHAEKIASYLAFKDIEFSHEVANYQHIIRAFGDEGKEHLQYAYSFFCRKEIVF